MKNLSKNQKFISLFFQVVSAFILGMASMAKFTHKPMAVEVFESLGIPETMLIIATVEAIAAILLLSPWAQYGAILAFGTMTGALIGHITSLGFNVNGDGGAMVMRLIIVTISSLIIMLSLIHI